MPFIRISQSGSLCSVEPHHIREKCNFHLINISSVTDPYTRLAIFKMKRNHFFTLTIMTLFTFSESTPATLCRYLPCSRKCASQYMLVVRHRYSGSTEHGLNSCSKDEVFCARTSPHGTIFKYQNANRLIRDDQWRSDDADDWCKRLRNGVAFWFEA